MRDHRQTPVTRAQGAQGSGELCTRRRPSMSLCSFLRIVVTVRTVLCVPTESSVLLAALYFGLPLRVIPVAATAVTGDLFANEQEEKDD